jgi:flagellar biosynthesis protein FlhF
MHYRRFRSSNVRDGLREVRETLGPRALVLSTTLVPSAGWRGWLGGREVEIVAAAERAVSDERPERSGPRQRTDAPATSDLTARLVAVGLSSDMATEVVESIPAGRRRGASLVSLRDALAQRLATLASADDDYAPVEVFVGPPGAGKTTTIAKIASQERARRGRSLGLVAADGFRVGAVEQLRIYADVLRAPFHVVRSADDLEAVLSTGRRRHVLVDTAGRAPTDPGAAELFDVLASRQDVRTHLVLPASTSPRAARRLFDTFAPARPSRLVITKLDEADSLASLVGVLRDQQLPISYLGTGQRVPEDLSRATARTLAASVLGDVPTWQTAHR